MNSKPRTKNAVRVAICLIAACALALTACSSSKEQQRAPIDDSEPESFQEEPTEEGPAYGEPQGEAPQQGAQLQQQPRQNPSADQQQPPAGGQPGGQAQPPSDEELDAFVDTYEEVVELQTTYQQRIQSAGSADEAREIRQEANMEVQQTVDDGELSREKFLTIMQQMQRDIELRKRIDERINQDG